MIEEIRQTEIEIEQQPVGNEPDYIKALQEQKANSVSKELYDKALEENRKLITALKEGSQVSLGEPTEKKDIAELRRDLFSNLEGGVPNLEMAKKLVALRDAILEDPKAWDPALPNGKGYKYNPQDEEEAEQVFQLMKHCIEYSEGDNDLFTQEFQRHIRDDGSMRKKK